MKTKSAPDKIKSSITILMNNHSFDKISVAMIVQQAAINRGTFYLHYEDKYALVEELSRTVQQQVLQLINKFPSHESAILTNEGITALLHYLEDEQDLIRGLLFSGADLQLQYRLKEILLTHVTIKDVHLPEIYAKEMIASHFMSILLLWLQRHCQEPLPEIAALLHTGTMSSEWHALYH